ncbi:MAG TPA: LytTR family transcriptional regulator DNA-binding domain-containing protein [Chitinophagales bacterium]|nr:LytTR family transcriptional regulator DNA-binding domain-containing protein [Chitinophagales bacterium]
MDLQLCFQDILRFDEDQKQSVSGHASSPTQTRDEKNSPLLRFLAGSRQVAFARSNDILFVEIQDHLLLVHLAANAKVFVVTRHQSLKDFCSILPANSFLQLKRFYLINTGRITGAHPDEQWFEFDFKFRISYKHYISPVLLQHLAQ